MDININKNKTQKYELFKNIMEHKSSRCGFWHGVPHGASREKLFGYFGVKDDFELGLKLGDSFVWLWNGHYAHPDGNGCFDLRKDRGHLPRLEELTDGEIDLVEKYNWPDAEYFDFSSFAAAKDRAKEHGVPALSGSWACFYHDMANLFGMEEYFMKMHTDPALIADITGRIADFYININKRQFDLYAQDINACFFGNDFGTQLDLMISPEMFRKFVMPYQAKIAAQAKAYGLYAFLHSCGSVIRVIPDMINAKIDGLHPIQALAAGMDAENLAEKFRGKIVFIGGVDTQILLREGSAKQIKDEVRRLKNIFGNNFFVSPSHEAVLPDVPPENIAAMAEAAHE
jgi:uroporphyrinogen decarboxylase